MAPRKRVRTIQRASDGSAFKRCDNCGILVAIALADMHPCEDSKPSKVKKLTSTNKCQNAAERFISEEPRSAFRFFMESFAKTGMNETLDELEIDRKGFATWKAMTFDERAPYILEADKVNSAYAKRTHQDVAAFRELYYDSDSEDVGHIKKRKK